MSTSTNGAANGDFKLLDAPVILQAPPAGERRTCLRHLPIDRSGLDAFICHQRNVYLQLVIWVLENESPAEPWFTRGSDLLQQLCGNNRILFSLPLRRQIRAKRSAVRMPH
jgi:hypothetical protein